MRARSLAALLVAACLSACGGRTTPTQPTIPGASEQGAIPVGAYRLLLTMSTSGQPVCVGNGCFSTSLCINTGGLQPIAVVSPIDVRIERAGDAYVVRPDDASATFRMELRLAGTSISGTASGQFRSGGIATSVDGGTPQSAAVVAGTTVPTVSGTMEGAVMVGGAGCSNNGHRWSIVPRLP